MIDKPCRYFSEDDKCRVLITHKCQFIRDNKQKYCDWYSSVQSPAKSKIEKVSGDSKSLAEKSKTETLVDCSDLQETFNQELLEKLAELEHEQWHEWSKSIYLNESLSALRITRWKRLWKPYNELTEEQKEQDRIWARKVLEIIGDINGK
jgi:hypothetical protein